VYSLTQAFGNQANNGTLLPYFRAGWSDWWNENPASPGYNTHVHQSNSPGGNSENLAAAGSVYSHAVVIDYNRWPARPGAGSGFFLHVTNGRATAGCVAISSANLDVVMRWLNPSQHPAISIGIGAQAIAPINRANAAAAAHNPFGSLDAGTAHGRQVRVTGWAADPDNRAAPLSIAVYYDGHGIGWFHSGVVRPDVQRIRHTGPRQGYDITVHLPPGRHQVCTYAINIGAGAGNPKLGCRTVTAA
jgi:hypothetical protein